MCVAVWEVLSFSASNVAIFRSVCMGPTLLDWKSREIRCKQVSIQMVIYVWHLKNYLPSFRANLTARSIIVFTFSETYSRKTWTFIQLRPTGPPTRVDLTAFKLPTKHINVFLRSLYVTQMLRRSPQCAGLIVGVWLSLACALNHKQRPRPECRVCLTFHAHFIRANTQTDKATGIGTSYHIFPRIDC